MTALSSAQRARHHELAVLLQASLVAVCELHNGYDFEFAWSLDTYDALAEITPLEHACCPFFDISIRIESEGGKLWWRLTGRDGVKKFIRAEFGVVVQRTALKPFSTPRCPGCTGKLVNCPTPVLKTCTSVRQRVVKDMTCADELLRA